MSSRNHTELRKFIAPEFIFGEGARHLAGQYAANFQAKKALVVTDPGIERAGWTEDVIASLAKAGISYTLFHDITPNPKDYEVMVGADIYQAQACDVIIAVGGGSVMDCAKGIGLVRSNDEHICTFEGIDEVSIPGPPLICIPTTAGTSADVSQFAIIMDTRRNVKIAIVTKIVVPDVALIDPETTTSMSPYLTATTGMDALVHAFEAYVSNASSPITDLHALEAIRLVQHHLIQAFRYPDDMTARHHMMLASLLAGLAFSNASLGLVHSMAHSLGGFLNLAHGECNAILLEHVVDLNFQHAREKYAQIAYSLGVQMAHETSDAIKIALLKALQALRTQVGITTRLHELGVRSEHIPQLAQYALHDPCSVTNPVMPTLHDIAQCYEKAL